MLIIGGSGTLFGPLLGEASIQWLFAIAGRAERFELLIYGVTFLLVVLYAPTGLAGAWRGGWKTGNRFQFQPLSAEEITAAAVDGQSIDTSVASRHDNVCLRIEAVSKMFGGMRAVQDVSFDVHFGQIVALIGPNGAGKSTLFNIISGIERPTQGRILLKGVDLCNTPNSSTSGFDRAVISGSAFGSKLDCLGKRRGASRLSPACAW